MQHATNQLAIEHLFAIFPNVEKEEPHGYVVNDLGFPGVKLEILHALFVKEEIIIGWRTVFRKSRIERENNVPAVIALGCLVVEEYFQRALVLKRQLERACSLIYITIFAMYHTQLHGVRWIV